MKHSKRVNKDLKYLTVNNDLKYLIMLGFLLVPFSGLYAGIIGFMISIGVLFAVSLLALLFQVVHRLTIIVILLKNEPESSPLTKKEETEIDVQMKAAWNR